jgi:hypothetical protein
VDGLMYLDATIIALFAAALALIALVLALILALRQRKLLKRYRLLLNGGATQDLEQLLLAQAGQLEQFQTELTQVRGHADLLAQQAQRHVQKTAIVRFNAFPDTGSDLSFAIALLDAQNNGIVLSSLYGRNENRVYAKPIAGGKSTYALSDEERQALAKAIDQAAH